MAATLRQLLYRSYTTTAMLWQPKNHFILPTICDWASSSFSILLSIALTLLSIASTLLAKAFRYSFWLSTILSSLDIHKEIKGNKIKMRKTKTREINDKFPNFAQQERQLKLEGRVRYAWLDVELDLLNGGGSFNSVIFLFSTFFLMCSSFLPLFKTTAWKYVIMAHIYCRLWWNLDINAF